MVGILSGKLPKYFIKRQDMDREGLLFNLALQFPQLNSDSPRHGVLIPTSMSSKSKGFIEPLSIANLSLKEVKKDQIGRDIVHGLA